jgi:hypothetical protein
MMYERGNSGSAHKEETMAEFIVPIELLVEAEDFDAALEVAIAYLRTGPWAWEFTGTPLPEAEVGW